MDKTIVPAIRFDGFDGEWELKPFGEIVERKSAVTRVTGGLNLEFEDIVSGAGVLNKDLSSKPNNKPGVPFSVGDVLFGKLRPYLKNWLRPNFDGVAVGDFWVLRPVDADPAFVYSTIQRSDFMRVANMSSGTKMPRSDWGLVSETIFGCPPPSEQADVGSFFSHLDTVLDAGEKKLQKLRALKQTMLTKMFPQGDSRVPEIRFEGFEGEWTSRTLGALGSTYTGLSGKTKDDFGHGLAKYVTYLNVNLNPITDSSAVDAIEIDERQNQVRRGDVLFTTSSEVPEEVGMSSVIEYSPINTYLNSFCFGYRPHKPIDTQFWAYALRSPFVRDQFTLLAQGISRFNISKIKAMEIDFLMPLPPEQQAIGAYFREFDVLLDAESRKLEKLRHLKSAFLSSMFV